jgi:hypothetical protein
MTTEGLLSLCHALDKLEASRARSGGQAAGLARIRLRLPAAPANRNRPQLTEFKLEKKPVQTEIDWPTNQLRLFPGVGR